MTEVIKEGARMYYTDTLYPEYTGKQCTITAIVAETECSEWEDTVRIRFDDGFEMETDAYNLDEELFRIRLTLDLTFPNEDVYLDWIKTMKDNIGHDYGDPIEMRVIEE